MHPLLDTIFNTGSYTTSSGKIVPIHSGTSREQCAFLQEIIRKNHFSKSIEIGFAYGLSTLAITEAISEQQGHHVVMDKFQMSDWEGVGLDLLQQAGYHNQLSFYGEYCYQLLPKLLQEGRRFDFAYVDSTKQLDWLLVDFFYLDKMLDVNGVIVFDDVIYESIRKLIRYISRFPSYRIYSVFPENRPMSLSRKLLSPLKYLPGSEKFLKSSLVLSDYELGINTSCVALQKMSEDTRKWDWHVDF